MNLEKCSYILHSQISMHPLTSSLILRIDNRHIKSHLTIINGKKKSLYGLNLSPLSNLFSEKTYRYIVRTEYYFYNPLFIYFLFFIFNERKK